MALQSLVKTWRREILRNQAVTVPNQTIACQQEQSGTVTWDVKCCGVKCLQVRGERTQSVSQKASSQAREHEQPSSTPPHRLITETQEMCAVNSSPVPTGQSQDRLTQSRKSKIKTEDVQCSFLFTKCYCAGNTFITKRRNSSILKTEGRKSASGLVQAESY